MLLETTEKTQRAAGSARIARGKIFDVKNVTADSIDGIILPGGFGAAKNLCTFALDGTDCRVDEDVARLLKEMNAKKKPIGALCIAPALIARLFGFELSPEITIGSDPGTAGALEKMGARHKKANTDEIVVDARNKIVTTPCYMTAQSIKDVGAGAEKLVEIIKFVGEEHSVGTGRWWIRSIYLLSV